MAIIEIPAPEVKEESQDFQDFDVKFTKFKEALDKLIVDNFRGALKVKIVMKKDQQGRISYNG